MCFNSCLPVTFLLACPTPERKLLAHEWSGDITDMSPTFNIQTSICFLWMKLLHASKTRALFSGDAVFGDCQGKTESMRHSCLTLVWTDYRTVRAAVGCVGKYISLLEQPVGRTCCGSWGLRGFWVSTKVACIMWRTQENFQIFSWKSESKWKMRVVVGQPDGGLRRALPWPSSAPAELGVLSVKSIESKASTTWCFICGCAFGGTGHPLHSPLCITIKHQTKALNLHLGQQEPFCTNWCVRNVLSLTLKGQWFPCSKYAHMSWRSCVQSREIGKEKGRWHQLCLSVPCCVHSPGEWISVPSRYGLIPLGTAGTIFTWKTANNMLHIRELLTNCFTCRLLI